jgi:hypothetical protein
MGGARGSGGLGLLVSESQSARGADELTASSAQSHGPAVPRAKGFGATFCSGEYGRVFGLRRGRDLIHAALRAAEAFEPDLACAAVERPDAYDFGEAPAADRTGHHLAGHVGGERIGFLERGRRTHALLAPAQQLLPSLAESGEAFALLG